MAPSIIYNNAVQGEVFLPGQIFVFGGFALRANSVGHLEQIESYAPGHQVRFGSLNFMADIRGDSIFNDAVQGEVFLPGQIFVFGGFVLRANSLGHLEQIDSYTPSHQVRFGNLNYVATSTET